MKDQNKKMSKKKMIMLIILAGVILELLLVGLIKLTSNKPSNNQGSGKTTGLALDDFYSSDSCRCLERDNLRCVNSSWQLDVKNRICTEGKLVTSVILGCSKYECGGTTYDFNNNTNSWEVK